MNQYDTEALAGQTFYRGLATPPVTGKYGYLQVLNPTGSGIRVFIDDFGVWPGLPGVVAEVGIMHYATPFVNLPSALPGFIYTGTVPLNCTHYGQPNSKTELSLAAYQGILNPWIDYVMTGPSNTIVQRLEHGPYPLIIEPGDGIIFWNPTMSYELKVQLWLRELPLS